MVEHFVPPTPAQKNDTSKGTKQAHLKGRKVSGNALDTEFLKTLPAKISGAFKTVMGIAILERIQRELELKVVKPLADIFNADILAHQPTLIKELLQIPVKYNPCLFLYYNYGRAAIPVMVGVVDPIWEEFVYRGFVQNILLREAPKALLQRLAPHRVHLIDSAPAKVLRVFTSALLFAWAHEGPAFSNTDLYSVAFAGAVWGAISEAHGIRRTIPIHIFNNGMQQFIRFLNN